MKVKILFSIIVFACTCKLTIAQKSNARSSALSSANILLIDEWSIIANPATSAFLEKTSVGSGIHRSYLIKELDEKSISFAFPFLKNHCFSSAYSQSGFALYKEQNLYFSYSKKFSDNISAGVQFNNYQIIPGEDYVHQNFNNLTLGIYAKVSKAIFVASTATINVSGKNDLMFPTSIHDRVAVGFRYAISEKLNLYLQGQQYISEMFKSSVGLEYEYYKDFFIRGGINSNPIQGSFGFGLKHKALKFSVSCSRHDNLGYSPSISIGFSK